MLDPTSNPPVMDIGQTMPSSKRGDLILLVVVLIAITITMSIAIATTPASGLERHTGHNAAVLSKLSLHQFPLARCLDGSPGAYYVRKAAGGKDRSWVFVLEGGSFCESPAACKNRSLSDLGSSLQYPDLWSLKEPYLSKSNRDNPLLHDWNVAYARSCDGAYFAGTAGAVAVGQDVLHYSGEHVLMAVVDDLASRDTDFKQAAEVLVAGASAGGIAVLAQLDAIKRTLQDRLNPDVQVYGFADSGFYMSKSGFVNAKRFAVEGQHAGRLFPEACRASYHGKEWKCLEADVGYIYLQTPVFLWQSRYDSDQIFVELDSACRDTTSCIEKYGQELQEAVVTAAQRIPYSGAFVDGCVHHCWGSYEPGGLHTATTRWTAYRNPVPFHAKGVTPVQALEQWYLQLPGAKTPTSQLRGQPGVQPIVIQQPGKYPCKECCAGWGP